VILNVEFLVKHRTIIRAKIEHALEFTDLRAMQFRPVVHEMSALQSDPSDTFLKIVHGPKKVDKHRLRLLILEKLWTS